MVSTRQPLKTMAKFIEIPQEYLAEIADDSDRIPRLYYASNYVLRRMFWRRLYSLTSMMNRTLDARESCLDFGGGAGVFLPTLSRSFEKVTLVDLEAHQAKLVKNRYGLDNVEIVQSDAAELDFTSKPFDAAVAADVLEHFKDLSLPIPRLHRWLKPGGVLFTSLPTENWVYVLLRKVFGIEKPWDHYHTAYEVEAQLEKNGFQRIRTSCVPLRFHIAPLFLITAWRRI
ncbi:Methyltransferase type 11 [Pedosphaera parvula Ellin514]|uniref:Methyltransferase type 11 n=2 Tax=Pedosphaera TaxID=1032526 RepID=B9XJT6_PEDPL|nr:Methyltransferase type 11 [Pedosphaera parvula Ellin514]